jgi:hypothetical protein
VFVLSRALGCSLGVVEASGQPLCSGHREIYVASILLKAYSKQEAGLSLLANKVVRGSDRVCDKR